MHRPLRDNIIVRKHISDSVIWLPPPSDPHALVQAQIIAVGPGVVAANGTRIPVGVQPGDTVYVNYHAGIELDNDDKLINLTDIYALSDPIRPLRDYILIEKLQRPTQTRTGIALPQANTSEASEAIVIATGPGTHDKHGRLTPVDAQPGDRVYTYKYGELKIDQYNLLPSNEVFAVIPAESRLDIEST